MEKIDEKSEEKKSNWSILSHIEWLVVFITLIGGFYSLDARIDALNSRIDMSIEMINSRMDSVNSRFDQFMISWHEECKDFHGRLIQQDAEYKAHLIHNHKEKG